MMCGNAMSTDQRGELEAPREPDDPRVRAFLDLLAEAIAEDLAREIAAERSDLAHQHVVRGEQEVREVRALSSP